MKETYQFSNIDMLKHGEMVFNEYQKIISSIENKNEQYFKEIGLSLDWNFIEKIKSLQYDYDTMKNYQIYHDCGKHISKTIDENGKIHYPNHAIHSSEIYAKYFENDIAKDLILKDLHFHSFKSEQLIDWIKIENNQTLASLYITAWSELIANSSMFGGFDTDSFKIKRKKLIQSGKKLQEKLK